jgi:hypothetical protein
VEVTAGAAGASPSQESVHRDRGQDADARKDPGQDDGHGVHGSKEQQRAAPVLYRSSIPVPAAKAATAAKADPEATKNSLADLGPSPAVNACRRHILAIPTRQ